MDMDRVVAGLGPDERVVWRQTAPASSLLGGKILGLAFSGAFAAAGIGVLVFGVLRAAPHADILLPAILGGVFSAIGIAGLAVGIPDFASAWSTHYVLTDRRLIIQSGDGRTESYRRGAFDPVDADSGVRGAVRFARCPMGRRGVGYHGHLHGVDAPRRVAQLIVTTLAPQRPAEPQSIPITRRGFAGDPVTGHLRPGERVLWRQQAPPLIVASRKTLLFLPIAFFSVGAIIPAHILSITPPPGPGAVLFAAVFILVFGGLTLLLAGALVDSIFDGWRTAYTLTDRRLFIATRRRVEVFVPAGFARIERTGNPRRGTLHASQGMSGRERGAHIWLVGVENPAHVEALLLAC